MRSPRDGRGGFLPKGHEDYLPPSPEDHSPVTDGPFHMCLSVTPILVTALVFYPVSLVVVKMPTTTCPGSAPCKFHRHCSLSLSINSHFIAFFSSELVWLCHPFSARTPTDTPREPNQKLGSKAARLIRSTQVSILWPRERGALEVPVGYISGWSRFPIHEIDK